MQEGTLLDRTNIDYLPDVLGDGFKKSTLSLKDDYEGKVVATLIRRKSETTSSKAILYVHGFNDYFFQGQMAKRFNLIGYNFYALDLRKYGRSYGSHQKLNNVRSLSEYDEELNLAVQIIKSEMNNQVILMGHSTGGLIVANYAGNHLNSDLFHGIICNSPFFEFNLGYFKRKIGIPILSILGRYFPNRMISSRFSKLYGYSLHIDKYGEWNYSLAWKPFEKPKVNLGFIRAIHKAQNNIKNRLVIDVPIVVLHSNSSIYGKHWSEKFKAGDAVLNVDHIRTYSHKIKGAVTIYGIENGIHDLFLSREPVREKVYQEVFDWIDRNIKLSV
ncbi:alpha/beta hydrolase [Maribacter arenosus]|uniref:Alpha/beta hydrolase n=1 Tax=Maribacter arenosus TaxID=1854708 RepID=A0ABR7VCW8_9FLAO|nr:alpha/beta hydrolase [Maribacter arenosus]MBD0851166.1 alpha/beta hydrolase [Maribacter arenosus]